MSERWDINCADCGKFILTEERECICGNIKCAAGSYEDGFYDKKEDVFYCKKCAEKHGLG